MSTLWTFGDSFTFGHGCRPDGPLLEYYNNYKTESDTIWPNLLGEMTNMDVKNLGKCGASNDYIIDSVIDNWKDIKNDDFVIIGITYHDRFDVPLNDILVSVFWDWDKYIDTAQKDSYEKEKVETLVNFQYHFANHELYKERHLKRLNFLIKQLKEKRINCFLWDVDFYQHSTRFEKIADDTNGEIEDYHFSFKGHRNFANTLYKKLINPTLI